MREKATEKEKTGTVLNVQRFSIDDGPGIRSTIFLKGCPLKCPWCSNPESLQLEPEIILGKEKCIGDGKCFEVCPQKAISLIEGTWSMDWRKCDSCLQCAEVCPSRRIKKAGTTMSVEEVMKEVMKDESLYRRTNGGITLSGGEPLAQWEFSLALLQEAKKNGLHTALDTSGYTELDIIEKLAEYTDLFLYDIKHMDSQKHKEVTGVPNGQILNNLQKIARQKKCTVWIWRPMIPGFNDSEEDMNAMCEFVLELGPAIEQIILLPFHKFGEGKYFAVGRKCQYSDLLSPSQEEIAEFKNMIEARGLHVNVLTP